MYMYIAQILHNVWFSSIMATIWQFFEAFLAFYIQWTKVWYVLQIVI